MKYNFLKITKVLFTILIVLFLITVFLWNSLSVSGKAIENYQEEIENLERQIVEQLCAQGYAHDMAEAARNLGYDEQHIIITIAQDEWAMAEEAIAALELQKTQLSALLEKEEDKKQAYTEFCEASIIWSFLIDNNFSQQVTAGILGNIMEEVGGHTLNLNCYASSPSYYGICQWSLKYTPQINGADLDTQLNHLVNTMQKEFDTFGKNYQTNFKYADFLVMTDIQEAALAFAKCYERCGPASYNNRKQNALKAYEYFVG